MKKFVDRNPVACLSFLSYLPATRMEGTWDLVNGRGGWEAGVTSVQSTGGLSKYCTQQGEGSQLIRVWNRRRREFAVSHDLGGTRKVLGLGASLKTEFTEPCTRPKETRPQ
jgi:hypothetical protein